MLSLSLAYHLCTAQVTHSRVTELVPIVTSVVPYQRHTGMATLHYNSLIGMGALAYLARPTLRMDT